MRLSKAELLSLARHEVREAGKYERAGLHSAAQRERINASQLRFLAGKRR